MNIESSELKNCVLRWRPQHHGLEVTVGAVFTDYRTFSATEKVLQLFGEYMAATARDGADPVALCRQLANIPEVRSLMPKDLLQDIEMSRK